MRSVLLINENTESLYLLKSFLRKEGYKVYSSHRIMEGFFKAQYKLPDLIMVNLDNTDSSKYNFIRKVRSDVKLADTFIVVISSKKDELSKVIAFELGCDDYVTEPLCYNEVLARIKALLRYSKKAISFPS
ncbi:MAG: hypothetical protein N3I35_13700 [Clostridia bacterium]|nr:hypothetical protein [Clostridia bacterium]